MKTATTMIEMKVQTIIIGTKSPSYNPFKPSGKNKAKRYFRHSLQRSVPMAPLLSEYFSNNFLSVKGLMGQFCQSM